MKPTKPRRSLLKCVNCDKHQWQLSIVEMRNKPLRHKYLLTCQYCEAEYDFKR